ncbi:MAG: hypothetical protein HY518_03935 [Candidatus Aenigmarchaeota archaeon]|nr:hypothetical protein [Candidatus Aenigmarchaeota archaeon]
MYLESIRIFRSEGVKAALNFSNPYFTEPANTGFLYTRFKWSFRKTLSRYGKPAEEAQNI